MASERSSASDERRASASAMPIGVDATMPISVRITVSGRPPQRSVPTGSRPNTPPNISVKKRAKASDQPSGEQARAAPRPERRQRARDQHRQHRAGRERRPPLLLVGVAAEHDQAPLLGDEAPARSRRRLAGRVVRRGDGVDHAPVEQAPAGPGERSEQDQRDQARAGPGEEARARPREQVRGRRERSGRAQPSMPDAASAARA